jgi:hypothetical protein
MREKNSDFQSEKNSPDDATNERTPRFFRRSFSSLVSFTPALMPIMDLEIFDMFVVVVVVASKLNQ